MNDFISNPAQHPHLFFIVTELKLFFDVNYEERDLYCL